MKKILALFGLFVVLAGSSYAGYAYWDSLTVADDGVTITIGEGTTLTIDAQVDVPEGKTLVPAGVVLGPNDVTSVVLSYDLILNKELAADLTLTTSVTNVELDGAASGLVNVVVSNPTTTVNGDVATTVTVTVTINMPADETEYNLLANGVITFDISFTAA